MEEEQKFSKEINSNKNHLITIEIKTKENKLLCYSHYTENYINTNYIGEFSLEELQKSSDYYKQFNDIKMIIKEIEAYTGDKKITIEESEDKNKIDIKFPIGSANFKEINFSLALKPKSDKEKIEEYEKAFEKYQTEIKSLNNYIEELKGKIKLLENRFIIQKFTSNIIPDNNYQKEIIKMWIAPFKNISAQLIYSYNFKHTTPMSSTNCNEVEKFHSKCDKIPNLLVICKSKNEIFGGYTPLFFLNDKTYGYDNDSFLFSINNLQKYPKKNQNNDKSIWRYGNYGPCFCYDLYFKENTINKVRFDNNKYTIPQNFINIKNAFIEDDWILVENMEIFQILFPD